MLGFKPRISGVGSDCSANLATTTAQGQIIVWSNSWSVKFSIGQIKHLTNFKIVLQSNFYYLKLQCIHLFSENQ